MYRTLNNLAEVKPVISTFRGLNRKYKGNSGEFYNMQNLSSSGYPCMVPRAGRTQLYSDYTDIRLLIEPINKTLSHEIPKFSGIATHNGQFGLYYDGKYIHPDEDSFPQRHYKTLKGQQKWLDMREIFPENQYTQYSYERFNNYLVIAISNTYSLDSLTIEDITDNVITVSETVTADYIGRNIEFDGRVNYGNANCDYKYKGYVEDITEHTLILNHNVICQTADSQANPLCVKTDAYTPYNTIGTELRVINDDIKIYLSPKGDKFYNMEQGVHHSDKITSMMVVNYTDTDTGITWENALQLGTSTTGTFNVFSTGDRIILDNCLIDTNNTRTAENSFETANKNYSYIAQVIAVTNDAKNMYVRLYDKDSKVFIAQAEPPHIDTGTTFSGLRYYDIHKYIPTTTAFTAHNGRLYGANPYGQYVYSSAAGDMFTWQTADEAIGTAAPITIPVSTKNEFTGIKSLGNYLILLKPTSFQQVYATNLASSVSVTRAIENIGCIDINSAVIIGATLYFLSYGGFCEYSGGEPSVISDKLNRSYVSATAFTDGVKYYANAVTTDGDNEFLVYDTARNYWHKEDALDVINGYVWYNTPIVATKNAVYKLNDANSTEGIEWSGETVLINDSTFDIKTVNAIWIRAYIPVGDTVTVYTKRNNESDWQEHFTLKGYGYIKPYFCQVKAKECDNYYIKLSGTGKCVIYDIERDVVEEGRDYRR